ncbi:MAG TPA: cellulase family glycosylhydrolase [Candidatus Saccharimonadales bacterium]|nr:cellulase family glycosylhydrolase [Candidatus Saccharimonadales bacterium]
MAVILTKQNKTNVIILCILFLFGILLLLLLLGRIKHQTEFNNKNIIAKKTTEHTLAGNTNRMFYGSNIDMSQLLPSSPYYIKNSKGEDLIDISHKLGITMLRISSVLQAFPNQTPDMIYTKEQWDTVLNKMNKYDMKAIIIAETYSTNKKLYTDVISDDFLVQMKKYIIDSNVGSNSAVYAIDMRNEPVLSTHNLAMIDEEKTLIKQKYPNMQVTVGGWKAETETADKNGKPIYRWNDAQDAQLLRSMVDFYSPHIYGFDQASDNSVAHLTAMVKGYLDTIETTANNKPILFSEFGSANGDSVSDQQTVGSKELQANTYYAMYKTLKEYEKANILGSVGYVLYSRNQFPDSWAILKDKGDYLYPAAYVLQKFSLGTADVNVPMPYTAVPKNIVLTDKDNLGQKNSNVSDMVLLSLPGLKANQYKLTITPPDSADIVQNLQYNSQYSKFFAIFTIKKAGTISISATQVTPTVNTSPIYTTILIAQ